MKIGIIAGEPSGDLLGANLIHSLRKLQPNLTISGVGGKQMISAGCHSLFDMNQLSVMGLVEPLLHLPTLLKMRSTLTQYFLKNKPDVFIGIDLPDFNLGIEMKLRAAGIPIVHYVSPSVWAWRKKRIYKIAKAVDLMLTLLPFEADFYQQHHVPVQFVGHPLADHIPLVSDKLAARQRLGLDAEVTYIAILPGSRRNEIKYLAPTFIETAKQCWQKNNNLQFITSAINQERNQEFQQHCQQVAPNLPIHFFENCSHDVMTAADVVLVTSGTATLETMLCKRPMVVAYKMASLTYQLARYLVKIPFMSLPNLLANQLLVPEFIQHAANPENLSAAILDFLSHPEKIATLEKTFTEMHQALRCDAGRKAAKAVMSVTVIPQMTHPRI